MNPRAKQFERDQRYAYLRDRTISVYLELRKLGHDTRLAWELARSVPASILDPALRS